MELADLLNQMYDEVLTITNLNTVYKARLQPERECLSLVNFKSIRPPGTPALPNKFRPMLPGLR